MHVKVVTLAYADSLGGFPQQAVDQACARGNVLEVRDHFFTHRGVPHLALVLIMDDTAGTPERAFSPEADPGRDLPEPLQGLYRNLRRWRNERAKADGVPAYVVLRNTQLAEICRRLPRSLAALREIEGIGEGTCEKYGKDLLSQLPRETAPEPPSEGKP